jgi:hypothetical protein
MTLLRFWSQCLSAFAGAGLVLTLWSVDTARDERRHAAEIAAAHKAEQDACDWMLSFSEETTNDYLAQIADLDRDLAAVRVRIPSRCVPVTPTPSCRADAAAGEGLSAGDGLTTDYLTAYAARCEAVRRRLEALQGWERQAGD